MVVFVAPVQVGGTVPVPVEPGQTPVDDPELGQAMPFAQAPQSSVPPQPSPILPQYWPPGGMQLVTDGVQAPPAPPEPPTAPPAPVLPAVPSSTAPAPPPLPATFPPPLPPAAPAVP